MATNGNGQRRDPLAELQALVARSTEYDANKHDYKLPASNLNFNDDCCLELPAGVFGAAPPVALTDHAYRQLYAKLGPGHFHSPNKGLPFDYLQAHAPDMRALLLNGHVLAERVANREYMVRCYGGSCRAVLHGEYPTIPNTDLLETVVEAIGGNMPPDTRLVRSAVDPDRLVLRIMWADTHRPDGNGGSYGVGSYIGNDEIGGGRIKIWPLVQRTSCENSIIFRPLRSARDVSIGDDSDTNYDEESDQRGDFVGLSLVHRGDRARLLLMVKQGIGLSLGAGAEFVEKLIVAETKRLPNFNDILADLTKRYNWSEDLKLAVAVGSEGHTTLAGMIHGVTAAAKTLADQQDQIDMETLGGSILVQPDTIFGQAARKREMAVVR